MSSTSFAARIRRIGWRRACAIALLACLVALNAIAYVQTRAMTHYATGGQRTPKPEALSLLDKARVVLTGVTVPRPDNEHTPQDAGLQYQARRISLAAGEYLEGWYVHAPSSSALVLMFPGYAESKESLLASATILHQLGYGVLMVDFRGVGGSSGSDTTLGVREAKDVVSAVGYARQQWPGQAIVLYGVSMGSAAVMRAVAVEGVQADALVLESPFDRLLTTVGNRFHALGLPATPGAELVLFWGSVQLGFNGFEHNPVEYATRVTSPTLLLYSDQDPRVAPPEARAVFDHLAGPKSFYSFAGGGHESLAVFAPEVWRTQVGQFLSTMHK